MAFNDYLKNLGDVWYIYMCLGNTHLYLSYTVLGTFNSSKAIIEKVTLNMTDVLPSM